ncbi:FecR family protein [Pedobacter sp. GR22-6]|uniref:FecR family protein n=1 Tax=Pedobacter sp. GR22-6 TaxID=3127957 RepID=UPI00307D42B2
MGKHSTEYKLFEKYINKTLTEDELSQLRLFFQQEEDKADWLLKTYFESDIEAFSDLHHRAETVENRAWQVIQARMNKVATVRKTAVHSWIPKFAAAAAVLLVLSLTTYFVNRSGAERSIASKAYSNDVLPGTSRATLVTGNGTVLQLNGAKEEIVVDGSAIRYKDGALVEDHQSNQNITLSTPMGGQYRVVLSDGTKVWLNAASSLSYPTNFSAKERIVALSGEAYFEVSHDASHPFIVRSAGQEIKVLGTSFNVNAYKDEPKTATTLIEGSVQLKPAGNLNPLQLHPGEQATLDLNGLATREVDAALFAAWKDGEFRFKATPLLEALRQISRWYDLDINYAGIPNDIQIHASINRNNQLSTVLHALEKITDLKFNVKGRSLKLMP